MAESRAQLLVQIPGGSFRFDLEAPTISIGADPSCTLSFPDQGLKPHHCVIQQEEGFEIFDLSLDDGLKVNGRTVGAAILCKGDRIEVGELVFTFLRSSTSKAGAGAKQASPAPSSPDLAAAPEKEASAASSKKTEDKPPRGLLSRLTFWRREVQAKDETAPHPAPKAANHKGFAEEMVEATRRASAIVISLAFHAILLVILSLIRTNRIVHEIVPPYYASVDTVDAIAEMPLDTEEEVEEPDPTVDEASEDPEILEVDVAPADEALAIDEALDDDPDRIETGIFEGGGVNLGDVGGGSFGSNHALAVGKNSFGKYVRNLRSSGLDIVFVIDSTGSMENVLDSARNQVAEMIDYLSALVPRSRLGAVTYRDEGDLYTTKAVALTPWRYEVVDFLDKLEAGGGGDIPEAVYEGLRDAIDGLNWSPRAKRLIIVLGDAQAHGNTLQPLKSLVRGFSRKKGVVHAIYTPEGGEEDISPQARSFFQDLARMGNGVYTVLGNRDAVLEKVLELAMGRGHKRELRAAIREVKASWRARTFRKMIASAGARRIWTRLHGRRVDTTFLRELNAANRGAFIPAYLSIIEDDRPSKGNRWAATVLLRRLLDRMPTLDPRVKALASRLAPDLARRKLATRIEVLKQALIASGLQVEMP